MYSRVEPSKSERRRRKRYLNATLVTCAAVAMLGGTVHVIKLGANRMTDMRDRASYDLKDMDSHLRAAGEDVILQRDNEHQLVIQDTYNLSEVQSLLSTEQWAELDRMIEIPAGAFMMGTDRQRSDIYDQPKHSVRLPAYRIDKYPVTNAQYARFVAATNHRPPLHWQNGQLPPGLELHPVTMVSWYDASSYAEWAGKRLPTEQEWEKAARGDQGYRWPWGENMDITRLNTYYNTGSTTSVLRYSDGASPYGVMDMAGNVSEWTADEFLAYEGSNAPSEVFQGKVAVASTPEDQAMKVVDLILVDEKYKVLRGGSWKSDPFSTAAYHRNFSWPQYASDFFGFRCAADITQTEQTK
jgi:iron(II)-dependent oxidoreductase